MTPDQMERFTIQAVSRFPHLADEVGLEAIDFGDALRRKYFEALQATRYFNEDGSVFVHHVAATAGIEAEWCDAEFTLAFNLPEQCRDVVQAFRRYSIGEQAKIEIQKVLTQTKDPMEAVQRAIEIGASRLKLADRSDMVLDLQEITLRYVADCRREMAGEIPIAAKIGIDALDAWWKGWRPGEVYVIVSIAGSGKSTFAQQLTSMVARQGRIGAIFSAEMSYTQIGERNAFALARVPLSRGDIREEWLLSKVNEGVALDDAGTRVVIDTRARITQSFVSGRLDRITLERGPIGLCVLDGLRQIKTSAPPYDETAQLNAAMAVCTEVAKDHNVPVLALHHLSKAALDGQTPTMKTIRGSQRVVDDSAGLACLWRTETGTELRVWKARDTHGVMDKVVYLDYDPSSQTYFQVGETK
jgi:energy-coupling factor transporter ATP-binding protein EcfA2